MPLVKAQCTNCGSNLDIDDGKDAAICPYCGTAYIVEKAIQNYNANNNIIYTDNVQISNDSAESLMKNGLVQLKLGAYEEANKTYIELTQKHPQYYQGWLGLAVAKCEGFDSYSFLPKGYGPALMGSLDLDLIKKAVMVADGDCKTKLSKLIDIITTKKNEVQDLFNKRSKLTQKINDKNEIASDYERSKNPSKVSNKNYSVSDFFNGAHELFEMIGGVIVILIIIGLIFSFIGKATSVTISVIAFLAIASIIIFLCVMSETKKKNEYYNALDSISNANNKIDEIDNKIRYICNPDTWEIDPYSLLEPK